VVLLADEDELRVAGGSTQAVGARAGEVMCAPSEGVCRRRTGRHCGWGRHGCDQGCGKEV
jgi:hypothetical protein